MPSRMTELPIFRSKLQPHVFGLLLLNPESTWTVADIAAAVDAPSVSVHRELQRGLRGGLLTREAVGRAHVYRAATSSPLYEPLRDLLERTVGVEAELRSALETVRGVESGFIHGSFAAKDHLNARSDIDLLVLGHMDPRQLRRAVRLVERRVGREIDVVSYTPEEFADLRRSGNSFARKVAQGPVIAIVGEPEQLRTP